MASVGLQLPQVLEPHLEQVVVLQHVRLPLGNLVPRLFSYELIGPHFNLKNLMLNLFLTIF